MATNHFDVIVIGTGPGGEGAAMQAVKHGKRVCAIERHSLIGGGCTHWGTIPSKALRFAIWQMVEANSNPLFREEGVRLQLSFPQLRKGAEAVIGKQVSLRRGFYDRNRATLIHGSARFRDPHTIEVTDSRGIDEVLTADNIVIATGSRPYHPAEIDFTHPRIHDSDSILSLTETPRVITIYGAGVIGCEYASMFANLRCKVNLVNTRDRLLDFLDDEITDALSYHMRDHGVRIRHGESATKIEGFDDGVILSLDSGKQLKSDVLLFALGRTGNSDSLSLETVGIEPNSRGQIAVNDDFQTTQPHIYAVGDVIGFPSLASAAYVQGRYTALHFCSGSAERTLVELIPTGIYTSPEISSVGKTERELTEAAIPYEVGHSMFKHLARAQILGQSVGMLKLLFHRDTLEVLGVHCFGPNASEIVHIGQMVMANEGGGNSLERFVNLTFNYPTMAEAYRVAALNGLNRLF